MATPSAGSAATAFGRALVAARKQRRKPRPIWGCKGSLAIEEGLAIKVSSVPIRPMPHVAPTPHDRGRTRPVPLDRGRTIDRSCRPSRRADGAHPTTRNQRYPRVTTDRRAAMPRTRGSHAPNRFAMPDRVVQSDDAVRMGPWHAAVGISGNARRRGSSLCSHLALGRSSSADAERTIPPGRTSRRLRR